MRENAEREKYNEWWGQISQDLFRVARRIVSDEAGDIVQDVGLMAIRNWDKFSTAEYEDFARWCHIRSKYLVLDELRKRSVRGRDLTPIDPDTLNAPTTNNDTVDLRRLVRHLPKKQNEVVSYMLEGYTTKEISDFMGIDPRTVRSHWRHAQVKLANMWERGN